MRSFILIFLLLASSLFGTTISGYKTRPSAEQVKKDFDSNNFAPYTDSFEIIQPQALVEKKIISDIKLLENNTGVTSTIEAQELMNCDIGNNDHFTSSVYSIDLESGSISCLVTNIADINNPFGIFNITYPKVREYFSKDLIDSESKNKKEILDAETRFDIIKIEKKNIKNSVLGNPNTHLSIPDLVMSVILTNNNIIDVKTTKDTNKIHLKSGLSSSIITTNGKVIDNNSEYILSDFSSILVNYAKLSDLSFYWFLSIVGFLAIFGIGGKIIDHFKKRDNNNHENIKYAGGFILAALFFLPTTQNDRIVENYDTMTNKFQSLERDGYSLFSGFSDDIAAAIIDTEIDSIIAKSGVGTGSSIINSYAGMMKYQKMYDFSKSFNYSCFRYYDYYGALQEVDEKDASKAIFTDNSSTLFPTSENWAYAEAQYNTKPNYYAYVANGDMSYSKVVHDLYDNINSSYKPDIGGVYFPKTTLASCGKNYFKILDYKKKLDSYTAVYKSVTSSDGKKNEKIMMIKELVKFQYTLQRDFGYLSILGLPVTKMQTEMIGSIYSDHNTAALDKLKQRITKEDDGSNILHSIFSSIPYMFVPGAGTVYDNITSTIRDLRRGYEDTALGFIAGKLGANVAVGTASNILGFSVSFLVAKSVLSVLPLLGIVMLGLLRYIVIIIKVFVLHFTALFLLPFAFFKDGTTTLVRFAIKIGSLMLELPIFTLSVWLAITANSLVHNIGSLFSKRIVTGMIENSDMQHTATKITFENVMDLNFGLTDTIKIYLIDGFFEVIIALFSVFIIYKIIVSTHTLIFETIELKSTETFDNIVESIKSDSANFGGKI